ncbi:hypothetical protein ACFV2U_04260 [Streptomyces sp. NPDC059697]|uniref:hypothetical protein n=1 Tax=Streptomyces sp. NPDC059697 TaxID=3346912 RepID=UPI0036CE3C3B
MNGHTATDGRRAMDGHMAMDGHTATDGRTAMDGPASDWVTLFRFENVPGRPRPGRLMAV